MKYDPKVIHEMADRLYVAADTAETSFPVVFGLVGAAAGFVIGVALGHLRVGALAGVILVGAVGYWVGQQRAFALRLQAQLMLVQTQIEENTRSKEPVAWVPQPSKDTRAAAHRISDALSR
jgi:urease accessory protein UreF